MTKKTALPDDMLDAISGGLMTFGAHKVIGADVDDSGVTLTLDSGDKYFRGHSAQDKAMFQSDPKFFQTLFNKSVTDDNIYAQADTSQYTKI